MVFRLRRLLLVGCVLGAPTFLRPSFSGQEAIDAAERDASLSSPAVPVPLLTCPGRDFVSFLRAFAEDPVLQRQYTRLPLRYVTVEEGPDGAAAWERLVPADSLPWPLLQPTRVREREGLELVIDSTEVGQRSVTVAVPDTDYQMNYLFVRDSVQGSQGACWKLVRYDNATL